MTDAKAKGDSRTRRIRAMLWSVVVIVAGSMLLPLAGYLYTAAVQAQASGDTANPRAEYWREVRGGMAGYTAVVGPETNVLIQSAGETWREIRNGPVITIGAIMVVGMILALAAFHLKTGGAKLEHRTGRTVLRWAAADRVLHWYTAVLFIVLAVTGLSLLWGRFVLIPLLGKEGFAAWASLAKVLHNYLALLFAVGLAVMFLKWFKHNIFEAHDKVWLKQGGGFLDGSHPPAGFCNAGEKIYYWVLVVFGAVVVISGFYLLFPNLDFVRSTMQYANIFHGASSLILITAVCAHMYLGTLGSEGAFEGMVSGEVDEGWAKQHHNLWLEEVKKQGGAPAGEGSAAGKSAAASA
jgi:formate dehydrogenase subunit gamma